MCSLNVDFPFRLLLQLLGMYRTALVSSAGVPGAREANRALVGLFFTTAKDEEILQYLDTRF